MTPAVRLTAEDHAEMSANFFRVTRHKWFPKPPPETKSVCPADEDFTAAPIPDEKWNRVRTLELFGLKGQRFPERFIRIIAKHGRIAVRVWIPSKQPPRRKSLLCSRCGRKRYIPRDCWIEGAEITCRKCTRRNRTFNYRPPTRRPLSVGEPFPEDYAVVSFADVWGDGCSEFRTLLRMYAWTGFWFGIRGSIPKAQRQRLSRAELGEVHSITETLPDEKPLPERADQLKDEELLMRFFRERSRAPLNVTNAVYSICVLGKSLKNAALEANASPNAIKKLLYRANDYLNGRSPKSCGINVTGTKKASGTPMGGT